MKTGYYFLFAILFFESCGISKLSVAPAKKYSKEQLTQDYDIFQSALEQSHAGIYWYTSKDSMDAFFKWGRDQIKDSATEASFRTILTFVAAQINCGHTSVRPSKASSRFTDTIRSKVFPLSLKLWKSSIAGADDTAVITTNLFRTDSVLKRGTIIKSVDDHPMQQLIDTMSRYISSDGYNKTHKLQSISNTGTFGRLYSMLYGLKENYKIEYADSTGITKKVLLLIYDPAKDSLLRRAIRALPPLSKEERRRRRLESTRILKVDSANHTAFMELHSFGKDYKLGKFFKQSFRNLHKYKIEHLIIDVRSNGGGSVTNSTAISKYLIQKPFKVADSLYAVKKRNSYGKYIQNNFLNKLFLTFLTRKNKKGEYHFGYFERHYFKPKKKNHFYGAVYILTGGNSFSATTLFADALIKQDNITVVGEETGGGAYGNTAWLIPDVTLPETGVRFRLPLFRLVIDKNILKNGRGVIPELEALPTQKTIKAGIDFKLEKAMELIMANKKNQLKTN